MHAFLCVYVVLFVFPPIVYGDEHILRLKCNGRSLLVCKICVYCYDQAVID